MSDAAARAHRSDWVDRIAGTGLVAFGVVHIVIGWLAVTLAVGDRQGSTSTTGAMHELAQQPFGEVLVWLVAAGMFLLAGWQGLEAAVGHRDEDGGARLRKRATSVGKAIVYAVIGVGAVSVGTGSSSGSEKQTDTLTSRLMDLPAGQVLVGLVGLGIAAVGVGLLVVAWRESYLDQLDGEGRSGDTGTAYRWLGRVGHAAKGVALLVVGALFGYAALTHEAKKSGGLDQALTKVLDQPFGPVLLVAMGLGFAAFGLFCFAQARHLDR